ncbi:molecular chaperone Hsp33 [Sphingomonas sp. Leaf407]|uniref:Hsp33 family molecular chaperone HslO n=1 Tax=unclassified Sphingomonas TaxID=196159 RepID=UPI0006F571DC|nr:MULTISPECIES: Hsp33 family molecular chaperone HslO [unclassified Sphingomonas]KQN40384.1 molecular chaperone Hsp33 [Sphingomonas sp. Leaf42]KQT29738.1 molecular chaperone Hsp33 [Sphingomonas sp. Leaf407]
MTDTVRLPDLDRAIGFTLPDHHARGRVVRLGPAAQAILDAHAYPAPIERLLAESLALTALLGSTLKDAEGQLTLQAQTQGGIVRLMVCDYKNGELRGYVDFDRERLAQLGKKPSLFALFGKGYLAITFDQVTSGERYQGIVPLDGDSIAAAAESYFLQSEQIPSLVRLGLGFDDNGARIAGGIFLQHLPEGEEGRERLHTRLDHPEWHHVEALGATMGADELADPMVPLETIVWRLFNEEREVRVLASTPLVRGCRCDRDYIAGVIAKFPVEERTDMADENGIITVDCAFCATKFPLALADITA